MKIPVGIIILLVLSLLVSAMLTWRYYRSHNVVGITGLWQIFEDYAAQALMLVTLSAAIVQVTVRYLLSGFVVVGWSEELALLALIWLSFWAGAAVTRKQDHIDFSVAFELMPAGMKRVMLVFGDILLIGMLATIAWFGYENARWLDIIMTVSLGLPVSTYAYAVPIALVIFVFHGVMNLIGHLKRIPDEPRRELKQKTAV